MATNKYFVFSDVHGEYKDLIESLGLAGYEKDNPSHILVSLGDNFDRGPESYNIYNLLVKNQAKNRAICIKGNHDAMFEEFLNKGSDGEYVLFNILHNGLGQTIQSFVGGGADLSVINANKLDSYKNVIIENIPRLQSFMSDMPLYYETKNYIFCHAGIDPTKWDWRDTSEKFMLWDIEHSHEPISHTNKKVVIGHHHACRVREMAKLNGLPVDDRLPLKIQSYGNTDENRPYCFCNKIAIDGLTNITHKVNVLVIEDEPLVEEPKAPTVNGENVTIKVNGDENFFTYYDMGNGTTITMNNNPYVTARGTTIGDYWGDNPYNR